MENRVRIFVVDDDEDDSFLLQEAFSYLDQGPVLETYHSGPALLKRLGELSPGNYPHLILLDMNLPGVHGGDVLRQLKSTSPMCLIPVLTLTSSTHESALLDMYRAGTNAVLRKTDHFDELVRLVWAIDQFWLKSAVLPVSMEQVPGNDLRRAA